MQAVEVLVMLPCLKFLPCVLHRNKVVAVGELIAQPTVERLDEPVVRGLSRPCVVELHTAAQGSFIERLGREFRAVVNGDSRGPSSLQRSVVQVFKFPMRWR